MRKSELQNFTVALGHRLKTLREKKGITQEKMSIEAGCSKNYISAIERGVHKLTVPMLIEYCRVLQLTPNEILQITEKMDEYTELINSLKPDELIKVKDFIKIIRT